jgi:uncharacterized membrane protein YhdT
VPGTSRAPGRPGRGVQVGVGLCALGVLFVLVDVLPFFAGADDRPLWLNLACLLLPIGLVVAVWSALARGRRDQRAALRAVEDARRP